MVLINADIGQVVRDTSVDQLQSEADRLSSPLNVVKVGEIRQRAQAALDSGNEAAAILIIRGAQTIPNDCTIPSCRSTTSG